MRCAQGRGLWQWECWAEAAFKHASGMSGRHLLCSGCECWAAGAPHLLLTIAAPAPHSRSLLVSPAKQVRRKNLAVAAARRGSIYVLGCSARSDQFNAAKAATFQQIVASFRVFAD